MESGVVLYDPRGSLSTQDILQFIESLLAIQSNDHFRCSLCRLATLVLIPVRYVGQRDYQTCNARLLAMVVAAHQMDVYGGNDTVHILW